MVMAFRRLKEKYENDLQTLEQTERLTREKYNETRTKLAESEANKQNMQSTVKQLELQLSHAQKVFVYYDQNVSLKIRFINRDIQQCLCLITPYSMDNSYRSKLFLDDLTPAI